MSPDDTTSSSTTTMSMSCSSMPIATSIFIVAAIAVGESVLPLHSIGSMKPFTISLHFLPPSFLGSGFILSMTTFLFFIAWMYSSPCSSLHLPPITPCSSDLYAGNQSDILPDSLCCLMSCSTAFSSSVASAMCITMYVSITPPTFSGCFAL